MRRLARLAAALAALAPGTAAAERLVLSMSANEIAIGPNYDGAQLVLYGIIERDSQSVSRGDPLDVVVTVRGPRTSLTVRQKEGLGPIWINRSQQKFVAVPAVLEVVSSRPIGEVASPAVRAKHRLGIEEVANGPELSLDRGGEDDPYRAALVRLKRRDGLWSESERGVTFVTPGFFRARLPLPAVAPTGNYDVEVVLLAGDAMLSRRNASFEVVKSGFEEQITTWSQERALTYGLLIAGLSVGFGWIASVIFRRD